MYTAMVCKTKKIIFERLQIKTINAYLKVLQIKDHCQIRSVDLRNILIDNVHKNKTKISYLNKVKHFNFTFNTTADL